MCLLDSLCAGKESFEEAEQRDAADTSDESLTKKRELYPGLCLPDNPEKVRNLLDPGDVKIAKAAMDEVFCKCVVCVCVCVCVCVSLHGYCVCYMCMDVVCVCVCDCTYMYMDVACLACVCVNVHVNTW